MRRFLALLALVSTAAATAAIIGHTTPAEPLTAERIQRSAVADKPVWLAYVATSRRLMAADKATLAAERRRGQPVPPPPREATNGAGLSLDRPAAWYASPQARAIADTVVSFQTPAGGWGKNLDRTAPPRRPGQDWIGADAKGGPFLSQDGVDDWSFVGTLDNDATIDELRFLARVQANAPGAAGDRYRASAVKGIGYLLRAQFPNGGWPQVFPLQGGYHDALTLNDDAMLHALMLLRDVAGGTGDFAFVPAELRAAAAAGAARAHATLLRAQVVIDGRPTIWAQQYDPLTLAPVAARNFEPIALATAESAAVLRFLMDDPAPDASVRAAIEAGVAWFRAHPVRDMAWDKSDDRRLLPRPGAPLLWGRFYDPATGKPIFGDRDRSIHDDVNAISRERRNGYSWFNTVGTSLDAAYARWKARR